MYGIKILLKLRTVKIINSFSITDFIKKKTKRNILTLKFIIFKLYLA